MIIKMGMHQTWQGRLHKNIVYIFICKSVTQTFERCRNSTSNKLLNPEYNNQGSQYRVCITKLNTKSRNLGLTLRLLSAFFLSFETISSDFIALQFEISTRILTMPFHRIFLISWYYSNFDISKRWSRTDLGRTTNLLLTGTYAQTLSHFPAPLNQSKGLFDTTKYSTNCSE